MAPEIALPPVPDREPPTAEDPPVLAESTAIPVLVVTLVEEHPRTKDIEAIDGMIFPIGFLLSAKKSH